VSAIRTTATSITFAAAFRLMGWPDLLSPGTYDIETDEEIVEGNTHTVHRRIATRLYLRSTGMVQAITVDPGELAAALAKDEAGRIAKAAQI